MVMADEVKVRFRRENVLRLLILISIFSSTQTWTFGAERKFSDSKENLATNTTSGSISPTVPNSLVSTLELECLSF